MELEPGSTEPLQVTLFEVTKPAEPAGTYLSYTLQRQKLSSEDMAHIIAEASDIEIRILATLNNIAAYQIDELRQILGRKQLTLDPMSTHSLMQHLNFRNQ